MAANHHAQLVVGVADVQMVVGVADVQVVDVEYVEMEGVCWKMVVELL